MIILKILFWFLVSLCLLIILALAFLGALIVFSCAAKVAYEHREGWAE